MIWDIVNSQTYGGDDVEDRYEIIEEIEPTEGSTVTAKMVTNDAFLYLDQAEQIVKAHNKV